MQTYNQSLATNHMAAFGSRLMSLSAEERQRLSSDSELMRQLLDTQLLLESRLQHPQNAKFATFQPQEQQHQYLHPELAYLDLYQRQMAAQLQQQHQLDQLLQQHQLDQQAQVAQPSGHQLVLDLSTGQPMAQLAPVNYLLNFAAMAAAGSAELSPPSQQQAQNPKKLKLSEYQRSQQQESSASSRQLAELQRPDKRARNSDQNSSALSENFGQQQFAFGLGQPASSFKPPTSCNLKQTGAAENLLATSANQPQQARQQPSKKYKGEFDEPTVGDVDARIAKLAFRDSYHFRWRERAQRCACILGTKFKDWTTDGFLGYLDWWAALPSEDRLHHKWDLADLPQDITLPDIKKFEEMRREASGGRADFGGASKRKPLGIRGTRQLLLMLYCYWGNPSRNDPMQKEGYCPHCFAKIKAPNEQSILVRVVNHFNMKHRKGANPRLSPKRDTTPLLGIAADPNLNAAAAGKAEPSNSTVTSAARTAQAAAGLVKLANESSKQLLKPCNRKGAVRALISSPPTSSSSPTTSSTKESLSETPSPRLAKTGAELASNHVTSSKPVQPERQQTDSSTYARPESAEVVAKPESSEIT